MKGRHKVHLLLGYLGILSTTIVVNACNDGRAQTPAPTNDIRDALTQLARSEGDLTPLTVTFDHLHPLHGGLHLTIRGDGTIEQRALRMNAGEPKDKVTPDDLRTLVGALVKHEVWTQRVAERQPVPDEGRATLRTCYRDQCVEIWEWYNDLEKNARIGRKRSTTSIASLPNGTAAASSADFGSTHLLRASGACLRRPQP